jgi:hypothetical protein
VLKNIDSLRESNTFNHLQILVFYDTCQDASLSILKEYKKSQHCPIEIFENPISLVAPRTERIAYARNGLLKMIRDQFSHYEYFAMMDSNDYSCVGKIRPFVLKEMLSRSAEWDSISFDREDGYYDHWALSYDPFIYSFFHFMDWQNAVAQLRADFNQRMQFYKENRPTELVRVYSAFNGFSLYKTPIFLDSRYSSDINSMVFPEGLLEKHCELIHQNIQNNFKNDCEHRFFHLYAIRRKNARICISLLSLFESTKGKDVIKKSANTMTFLMKKGRQH